MGLNVLILGCGPAGLIAAHAASGHKEVDNVRILSKPRKSHMLGAQYLHEPIPGVPSEQFEINYKLLGEVAIYREKVYGRQWDGIVSPEDFIGKHPAWDIREAYDWLWATYGEYVAQYDVTPMALRQTLGAIDPHITISTVPGPLLCAEGHHFAASNIWSSDMAIQHTPADTVVCNGDWDYGWYRASTIRGHSNTEWPDQRKPPITPLWGVTKPLKNNCDCFPNVRRMGRYGKWEKGVLSHNAYAETLAVIEEHLK